MPLHNSPGCMRSLLKRLVKIVGFLALIAGSGPTYSGQPLDSVSATIHPANSVRVGEIVRISFGLPFSEGSLEDPGRIRILDATGNEVPAVADPLVKWVDRNAGVTLKSWRSVLVQFEWRFSDIKPQQIRVEWGGGARTRSLNNVVPPGKDWIAVDDREYPATAKVREPRVYTTLPAEYLVQAGIFPETMPFAKKSRHGDFSFINEAHVKFFSTAVNDVGPGIKESEKINYLTDNEPWLYDRATVFFRTYVRSGRLEHLRAAHRAADFYAMHVDANGYFDIKREHDAKYSYSESMFTDMLLFGNRAHLGKIEDVTRATSQVRLHYANPEHFWTERHVAYRVLNAVVAYEATGKDAYIKRAREDIASLISMQTNPPEFIPSRLRREGCFVHTALSHGEGNADEYVCSPWMSVLIIGAMQRYDWYGKDRKIAESVMRLADFVLGSGSRVDGKWIDGPRPNQPRIPYYLATQEKVLEGDPWADKEHALDVSKITALAHFYAKRFTDPRAEAYRRGTLELIGSARANLAQWIRTDGPSYGKPVYRLSPPRKFNWWFYPYHDIEYLLAAQ